MSISGDYLSEMDRNGTTDVEIENLLSGSPNLGDDLRPLAEFLAVLRFDPAYELDDAAVARLVGVASAVSTATPTPAAAEPHPRRGSLMRNLRRRAAAVTVAATVVLGGTSGLAYAADGAKPGDALYGFDRALEAVGIGAGATQERLSEAEALVNADEVIRGLQHAAEAFDENAADGSEATRALMSAADRVRSAGVESSAETRDRVAGLLTYLSENAGAVDGQQVAELAVQIGRPEDHPNASPSPDGVGNPATPTPGPVDPPGLTDREPGPPDHVPANPPGQDKDKSKDKDKNEPGPPDSKPNPPNNKP